MSVENRFKIDDSHHGAFGKLIKDWAKGTEEVPRNLKEFKQALQMRGIVAHYPDEENELFDLNIIKGEPHRLDIRLPPKSFVEASEAYLRAGGAYPLPTWYPGLFGGAEMTIPEDGDGKIEVHNMRVGDYTVANCG